MECFKTTFITFSLIVFTRYLEKDPLSSSFFPSSSLPSFVSFPFPLPTPHIILPCSTGSHTANPRGLAAPEPQGTQNAYTLVRTPVQIAQRSCCSFSVPPSKACGVSPTTIYGQNSQNCACIHEERNWTLQLSKNNSKTQTDTSCHVFNQSSFLTSSKFSAQPQVCFRNNCFFLS